MAFRTQVEGFLSSIDPSAPEYNSRFLLPIADYSNPIRLQKLRQATRQLIPGEIRALKLQAGRLLDQKELSWVMATDGWQETTESTQNLLSAMPPGVVSPNANRVAIWKRLERAFQRVPVKVAAYDSRAFFIIQGTQDYLVTIDFKRKLIASSCPEYNSVNDNARRRFELCKHSISALIYYRTELYSRSGLPKSEVDGWETSFKSCQSMSHAIRANWYYYFLRNFLPALGLSAAYYKDSTSIGPAIQFMLGAKQ
jgi:hypothetical protein